MSKPKFTIIKKASIRHFAPDLRTIHKGLGEGESINIVEVAGVARGLKHGSSVHGDWTALMGSFVGQAITGDNAGKRFRTGQLFLPDVAMNLLVAAVDNMDKGDTGVEFSFRIGITDDKTAATGYIYTCEFLREPEVNDPVDLLLSDLSKPEAIAPDEKTETETKTVAKTSK